MMTLDTALSNMTSYTLTGGAAIDPSIATDTDYICLAPINTTVCDWPKKDTKYEDENETLCLSLDNVDLIIVTNPSIYDKWVLATNLCRYMALTSKSSRKALFRALVLGISPGEIPAHVPFIRPTVEDPFSQPKNDNTDIPF